MALGPTASPSKVSPHLASLPPLLRSRSPSPPLSQPPQHRARSITSPPQSNGTLGPGPATPPHQTLQTIKKRKWTHLTPETPQPGALSPFTSRNRFDELSHLSEDDMRRSDEDLPATADNPRAQPREHKPPPIYMYGITIITTWCPTSRCECGGGTQAEPDGHNINKTACHQITSYTVDLSNFSLTLFYAP